MVPSESEDFTPFSVTVSPEVAVGLSACGGKFRTYNGPEVTSIQVHKADRKMYLLHNGEVLESYDIGLGFAPEGHKQFEGDGKTPEGTYYITHKNPRSEFHLSLGPFRQVVKDYFQICESYFDAVKRLPPSQIEAIDMARRGIHNEGARVLQERLEGKAVVDTATSRRLFTLICVLHWG